MSRKIFHRLRDIDDVLNELSAYVRPLGVEEVEISDALGRVLAEDILSPITLPPFDRSSVDGYAVRASDVALAEEYSPIRLALKGHVDVGEAPSCSVDKGEAVEVMTGAAIPPGADAVVMEEFVDRVNGSILVYRSVASGENIFEAGSDFVLGEFVLKRGIRLGFKEIGILSALGVKRVRVYIRPKVAVFSTGNELQEPGNDLRIGQVYDCNGPLVRALLKEVGCSADYLGIIPDDVGVLKSEIIRALDHYDLIVISGGTSAGEHDIVYHVLGELGEILAHGLKTKPGKPTVIAMVKGKPVIGLPGHPVSAAIIALRLVIPLVKRMLGLREESLMLRAMITRDIPLERGKLNVIPVAVLSREELLAYPTFRGSGLISSLLRADGYIEVAGDRERINRGETFPVTLFNPRELPDLVFIGSHCPGVERLLRRFSRELTNPRLIFVGSTEGLLSAIRGEADLAGAHLLDEATGSYNIPYIKMYKAEERVFLVRGYLRRQGLIVAKGNPRRIKGFEDLLRDDIRFINRNRGSGTRILLDMRLREIARKRGMSFQELISQIKGYRLEARTHTAVALAIAQGKADVGLGIECMAKLYDLDFIPVAEEEYDFLIPRSRLNYAPVKRFLDFLGTEEARELLNELPGITPRDDMGTLVDPLSYSS